MSFTSHVRASRKFWELPEISIAFLEALWCLYKHLEAFWVTWKRKTCKYLLNFFKVNISTLELFGFFFESLDEAFKLYVKVFCKLFEVDLMFMSAIWSFRKVLKALKTFKLFVKLFQASWRFCKLLDIRNWF